MTVPRFSKILYDFESFLAVERNLSPATRQAYVYDVDRFAEYLVLRYKKTPSVDGIATDDIRSYLEYLQEKRRLRGVTLSRTISSIRRFFDFCTERGYIAASPASAIHNPKSPKKLPVFLIAGELKQLFEGPDRSTWRGRRDYAILVVLAFTGMRLKEIVGLDLDDLDLTTRQVRVVGKGARERFVPLNEMVVEAVSDYLRERPATADPALFLGRNQKRISRSTIKWIVPKYAKAAGIFKKHISPHKLRHTFATLLHMKDVDLVEIQSLLGHSSITSTQIYTHTHPGKLKAAVEKLRDI
ncbi:tyrosine-type recombinase/integrase [Candidatus Sumerlaeota bacterium]|nr:tyrosine-type recombinase/integrase [Candidatus Sumerlaeota bacterium]